MSSKIAIIGITGSGKSWAGRRLAEKTGLPLYHMDALFWKSGWTEVPEAEYIKGQEELLKNEKWIIEGYIDPPLVERALQAELIMYLDYSGWLCAWRYIRRSFEHHSVARQELPADCFDVFTWKRFWMILTRKERIQIERTLDLLPHQANIIRVSSPTAFDSMVERYTEKNEWS